MEQLQQFQQQFTGTNTTVPGRQIQKNTRRRNRHDWCSYQERMKPQSNAISPGIVQMLVSGLHIGWNIFNDNIRAESWAQDTHAALIMLTLVSFYIGSILGAVAGAFWTKRGDKSKIYKVSCLIAAISCSVIIMYPGLWYTVMISKILGGFAHTLNYMNLVIHAGEIVVKRIRGMVVASIHFCTAVSIFTSIVLVHALKSNPTAIQPARMIGILGAAYCIMSLSLVPTFFKDSPVLLIKKGRCDDALELMIKLRSEKQENHKIRCDFEEFKIMIEEDNELNGSIFGNDNIRPLMLVTLTTVVYVVSFNYPLNNIRLTLTNLEYLRNFDISSVLLLVVRTITGLIITATFDKFRRKSIQYLSAGLSGLLLIVIGLTYAGTSQLHPSPYVWLTFFLVYETFGSIGMGAVQTVYASEAFPTKKKSQSIGFVCCVESILHGILISSTHFVNRRSEYFVYATVFTCAVLMIFISKFLHYTLPETRLLSLRRTRDAFRQRGKVYDTYRSPTLSPSSSIYNYNI